MSDWVSVLVPFLTISVPSIVSAYFAYKAAITSERTEKNTNHLKDELVASVKDAAFQAGIKQEKEGNDSTRIL